MAPGGTSFVIRICCILRTINLEIYPTRDSERRILFPGAPFKVPSVSAVCGKGWFSAVALKVVSKTSAPGLIRYGGYNIPMEDVRCTSIGVEALGVEILRSSASAVRRSFGLCESNPIRICSVVVCKAICCQICCVTK